MFQISTKHKPVPNAKIQAVTLKVDQCFSKNNVEVSCENQAVLDDTILKVVPSGKQTLVVAYLPCCVGSVDPTCDKPCP